MGAEDEGACGERASTAGRGGAVQWPSVPGHALLAGAVHGSFGVVPTAHRFRHIGRKEINRFLRFQGKVLPERALADLASHSALWLLRMESAMSAAALCTARFVFVGVEPQLESLLLAVECHGVLIDLADGVIVPQGWDSEPMVVVVARNRREMQRVADVGVAGGEEGRRRGVQAQIERRVEAELRPEWLAAAASQRMARWWPDGDGQV